MAKITSEVSYQWVLGHELFKRWASEDVEHPLIWAYDNPGVSTKTLAIYIKEYLERFHVTSDEHYVLYFWCNSHEEGRDIVESMLDGIILQLGRRDAGAATVLRLELNVVPDKLRTMVSRWRTLKRMIDVSSVDRIFCVIDGLDQCRELAVHRFLYRTKRILEMYNELLSLNRAETMQGGPSNISSRPGCSPASSTKLRMFISIHGRSDSIVEELSFFPQLELGRSRAAERETDPGRGPDPEGDFESGEEFHSSREPGSARGQDSRPESQSGEALDSSGESKSGEPIDVAVSESQFKHSPGNESDSRHAPEPPRTMGHAYTDINLSGNARGQFGDSYYTFNVGIAPLIPSYSRG